MQINFQIQALLQTKAPLQQDGAIALFVEMLEHLRARVPALKTDYVTQHGEFEPVLDFDKDREAYLDSYRGQFTFEGASYDHTSILAQAYTPDMSNRLAAVSLSYLPGQNWSAVLEIDLDAPPIRSDAQMPRLVHLIFDVLSDRYTWWRIRGLPSAYAANVPLQRSMERFGWAQWVPDILTADQVPEAEAVEPMNGGTYLQVTRAPFITRDEAIIAAVQDFEIRMNLLGL